MKPIESLGNITFTYAGETFKRTAPNSYVRVTSDGEQEITKKSDDLMDALLGGDIVE